VRIHLIPQGVHPDFLDLPWELPLEDWESRRLVEVVRGIGRHVVRFVEYEGTHYALKEIPQPLAEREYRVLRELPRRGVPAVDPVGVVADRDGLDAILITRYLEFSLPYRRLLAQQMVQRTWERVLDSLAELLVRLHLAGLFWGDCSLSNALFRRDAGELCAYLVDAETSELHGELSDGQRAHDLVIAEENLAGELFDLCGELGRRELDLPLAPDELALEVRLRYERLWAELTDAEVFAPTERFRLEERVRRLNDLGFDVDEVELVATDGGYRLNLHSRVVEPGHHRRLLLHLTGLDAQENQARRLLNDITAFRAQLERQGEQPVSEVAVAGGWLTSVFEPAVAAIPSELRGKRAAAELFHELLDYRWRLSEAHGSDVDLSAAVESYVEEVLRNVPDERTAIVTEARDGGPGL
jgi:tRNA A-37 threonylcarbamoyl transferase component Bud32